MSEWVGVVLAAGEGRRMNSNIPKVLHQVCGKPMISHVVEGLKRAGVERVLVVASSANREGIQQVLGDSVEYVVQSQPLGTGHAVMQFSDAVGNPHANVLVAMGDAPLIHPRTFTDLMARHSESNAALTLLTARDSKQRDLGRVRRDDDGMVCAVVEASDAGGMDLGDEVNAGVYCFNGSVALGQREPDPAQHKRRILSDLACRGGRVTREMIVEALILSGWGGGHRR